MSDVCMLSWRTAQTPKTHTHRCTRGIDHHGTCRCVCGEFLPEFVGSRGSAAVRYPTSGRAAIARHGMSTVEMTPAPLISMRDTLHHTDPVVSRVPCRASSSFSDLAAFVVAVAVAIAATVAGIVLWRSADRVTASAPFLLAGAMGYCAACLMRGAS